MLEVARQTLATHFHLEVSLCALSGVNESPDLSKKNTLNDYLFVFTALVGSKHNGVRGSVMEQFLQKKKKISKGI